MTRTISFASSFDPRAAVWQPGAFVVHGRHTIRIAVLPARPAARVADGSVYEVAANVRETLLEARRLT